MTTTDATQEEHNAAVRTQCEDVESVICTKLKLTDASVQRREELNQLQAEAQQYLRTFENEYAFYFDEPFPSERLLNLAHLKLSPTDLYDPKGLAEFDCGVDLWKRVDDMAQRCPDEFRDALERVSGVLQIFVQEIRRTQLDDSCLSILPMNILQVMEKWMALPDPLGKMAPTDNKLQELLEKIVQIQLPADDKPIRDDDIQLAEEQLRIREELLDVVQVKFDVVRKLQEAVDPFQKVGEHIPQCLSATRPMKEAKRDLRERSRIDLQSVVEERQRQLDINEQKVKSYAMGLAASDTFLEENQVKQNALWQQIRMAEEELELLGGQRLKEADRRMEAKHDEELRLAEHEQYLRGLADHAKLLQATILNCEVFVECGQRIDECVEALTDAAVAAYKAKRTELDGMELQAHKEHYDYFKLYRRVLPMLISYNEGNLERIYGAMSKESYKFTFLYRERRAENEQDIALLLQDADQHYNRFKPSVAALRAAGVDVVDPATEDLPMSERARERKYTLQQYRRAFSGLGEEDIDEMKTFQEERASGSGGTQVRRPENHFTLTNPLATPRQLEQSIKGGQERRPVVEGTRVSPVKSRPVAEVSRVGPPDTPPSPYGAPRPMPGGGDVRRPIAGRRAGPPGLCGSPGAVMTPNKGSPGARTPRRLYGLTRSMELPEAELQGADVVDPAEVNEMSERRSTSPLRRDVLPAHPSVASRSALATRSEDAIRKPSSNQAADIIRDRATSPPRDAPNINSDDMGVPRRRDRYESPRPRRTMVSATNAPPETEEGPDPYQEHFGLPPTNFKVLEAAAVNRDREREHHAAVRGFQAPGYRPAAGTTPQRLGR